MGGFFMAEYVYILQSEKTGGYYIGQTDDIEKRLMQHNSIDNVEYTKRDQPWALIKTFQCDCRLQARTIERHIKNMKNRKYIQDIIKHSEIFEKLKIKYPCI
ncbi:MAG: GIY-YIG nuclease family protein [Bacteroidetes bacterium]|nr:GIY-YIG nuclease family protein [Bacteroidota bacterium]MBK8683425.1 GIY-YIG nuclease family protein [Bacteroidota bacterium]